MFFNTEIACVSSQQTTSQRVLRLPNTYLTRGTINFTGISGIPSLAEGGFSASRGTSVSMQAVESDTISDEKLFGIWKTVSLNAPQPPSNPLSSSDYDHKRADFKFELGLGRDYSFAKNIDENITVYHGGENETLTIASQIGALPNFVNSAGTLKFAGAGTQRASWIDLRGGTVDSHNDHRIAMAAAIAATVCTEPVTILGAEAVQKSYPSFWEEYHRLGGQYEQYLR